VGFGILWEHDPGQQIGIHKGQTQGLKGQPVKRALAGPIAAHEYPQLGLLAQGALVAQGRNTPSSKVPMAVCIS
jgi:hypothetical protein